MNALELFDYEQFVKWARDSMRLAWWLGVILLAVLLLEPRPAHAQYWPPGRCLTGIINPTNGRCMRASQPRRRCENGLVHCLDNPNRCCHP